ncbi:hypothetical protein Chy2_0050 [Mycobacterium phage Chy2]|nr:hypothetical protein Chy2_0050 [Mycobacterium phage Chy2]
MLRFVLFARCATVEPDQVPAVGVSAARAGASTPQRIMFGLAQIPADELFDFGEVLVE